MATELDVAANAKAKIRDLSAEQTPFPFENILIYKEQLKSKNYASNINLETKNIMKWLQEWIMVMDGQPMLTAAIKFLKPKGTDEEIQEIGRKKFQSATAMWDNSNHALKSKLLLACQENVSAKNLVLRMNSENKNIVEILQRLLNDYAKVSSSQTQRLNAILLSNEMDKSKSKTPGQSLIQAAEAIQNEIQDAGGECSNDYLKSVLLERAKRMEPLKLMIHAFSESFNAMGTEMSYEQLRTRLMTADNEIMILSAEETEKETETKTNDSAKEASNAERGRRPKCKTCHKFHRGVCKFKNARDTEAHQASGVKTCDYCHKTGHTEDDCWAKEGAKSRTMRERDDRRDGRDEREDREYDRRDRDRSPSRGDIDRPLRAQRDQGRRVIYHERDDYKRRRAHVAEADDTDFDGQYEDYYRRGNMFASQAHVLLLTDKKDIIDSGATDVFVRNTTRVDDYERQRESMSTAKSGSSMDILGRGTMVDGRLPISVCDQRLTRNLVGVAPITDLDFTFIFNKRHCKIVYDKNSKKELILPRHGNLYPCDIEEIAEFIKTSLPITRRMQAASVERESDEKSDFDQSI